MLGHNVKVVEHEGEKNGDEIIKRSSTFSHLREGLELVADCVSYGNVISGMNVLSIFLFTRTYFH